jgi:hypothetical protein
MSEENVDIDLQICEKEENEYQEEWVSLQFDDKIFTTSLETLFSDKDSIFCSIFSKEFRLNLKRDETHPKVKK